MTPDVSHLRSVMERLLAMQQAEKYDRLFRRPPNLKRDAMSSASKMAIHAASDHMTARQLADVLAWAYRSLGLTHLDART